MNTYKWEARELPWWNWIYKPHAVIFRINPHPWYSRKWGQPTKRKLFKNTLNSCFNTHGFRNVLQKFNAKQCKITLSKQYYLVIILRAAPIPLPFSSYSAPIINAKYCNKILGIYNLISTCYLLYNMVIVISSIIFSRWVNLQIQTILLYPTMRPRQTVPKTNTHVRPVTERFVRWRSATA